MSATKEFNHDAIESAARNRQQEIISGNQSISIFLDASEYNFGGEIKYAFSVPTLPESYIRAENLKFHSSWDWLMVAVYKIESMGHKIRIENGMCMLTDIMFEGSGCIPFKQGDGDKLTSTWIVVVNFVKWFNKQKESNAS